MLHLDWFLDDEKEIWKSFNDLQALFEKGNINNIEIPQKSDEAMEVATAESLEDLTRKCNDDINNIHAETSKIKKNLQFVQSRLLDHV